MSTARTFAGSIVITTRRSFSSCTAEGRPTNFPHLFVLGQKAKLSDAARGPKQAQLPLSLQVVDLGR